MRLRRITQHVQAQNWTAVALDLLIVVVGVFIGIQVSNWNDARLDRAEARVVLDRLEQDFELNLSLTTRSIDTHRRNLESTAHLLRSIESSVVDRASAGGQLNDAADWSTPSAPSTTFRELVSGGRLRLVEDPELRRALQEYDDYVALIRDQYSVFTTPLIQSRDVLLAAQRHAFSGEPAPSIAALGASADVRAEVLLRDPQIRRALESAYLTQDNLHAILVGNRQRIEDILFLIRDAQQR